MTPRPVGGAPAPGRPGLAVLLELRLVLALRRVRSGRGLADGVARLLLVLVALPVSAGFAAVVAVGSHRAALAGRGLVADVTLGATLFGIWQAWTAVSLTVAERDALDLGRLLVYPVAPWRLYAVSLLAALAADPFSLFWTLLLAGLPAGAAVARPGPWVLLVVVLVALFGAATVALVAVLQELFARWARGRLARELTAVASIAGWLALVLAAGSGPGARSALGRFAWARWILAPPALATEAARALYAGRAIAAVPWLLALGALAALCAAAAYRLALATARSGGEGSWEEAPPARALASRVPERLGPVFEKELRTLARHPAPRAYLLLLPALSAVLAWKLPRSVGGPAATEVGELVRVLPLFGLAAYAHLVFQTFWSNPLGLERGGLRALFLAPLRPERILAAKNLALLAWTLAVFAPSCLAYVAVSGPTPAWAALGALALTVGLAPVVHGLGNVIGVVAPWRASFGLGRSGAPSALGALLGTFVTSGAAALYGAPVLLLVRLDALAALPWAWAGLAAMAWLLWWRTLPLTARLLERRREALLDEVGGEGGPG